MSTESKSGMSGAKRLKVQSWLATNAQRLNGMRIDEVKRLMETETGVAVTGNTVRTYVQQIKDALNVDIQIDVDRDNPMTILYNKLDEHRQKIETLEAKVAELDTWKRIETLNRK